MALPVFSKLCTTIYFLLCDKSVTFLKLCFNLLSVNISSISIWFNTHNDPIKIIVISLLFYLKFMKDMILNEGATKQYYGFAHICSH